MNHSLQPFIIRDALPLILDWLNKDAVYLHLSNRKGRILGFYQPPQKTLFKSVKNLHQINIQISLNPYTLLFTLIHEWAHLITRQQTPHVRPHGKEWKNNFKEIIRPFLTPDIFPADILESLDLYFKKTGACFDRNLQTVCNRYGKNRKEFIKIYARMAERGEWIPAPATIENHYWVQKECQEERPSTVQPSPTFVATEKCLAKALSPLQWFKIEDKIYRTQSVENGYILASTGDKTVRIHSLVSVTPLIPANNSSESTASI